MAKKLTANKAKEILHDKSVHGHPLTDKQRRFFGAIAGGAPVKAKEGWLEKYAGGGTMQEYQENYNDNTTSYPPGFVGMGNNTKGRNYSPAWGGQFEYGGDVFQAQNGKKKKNKLPLEDRMNNWLGYPMDKGEAKAEQIGEKWYNPRTKRWEEDDARDNLRHPLAGRYTAEAIANKFPSWMQYTPIPKVAGFIGANALGIGHELKEPNINHSYSFWDTIREGGEDAFNNMVGAGIGSLPFISSDTKTNILKYLSDNNLLPDGVANVNPEVNNGKDNLYIDKKAMGGSIPGAVGFTYARTQGAAPSNGPYAKKTKASAQDGGYFQNYMDKMNQEYKDWYSVNRGKDDGFDSFYYDYLQKQDPIITTTGPTWEITNPKYPEDAPIYTRPEDLELDKDAQRRIKQGKLNAKLIDSYTTKDRDNSMDEYNTLLTRYLLSKNLPKQENGGMTYYQHGLDWKPKSISRNGSDIPKNQNAQVVLPNPRDLAKANVSASESTSRVYNTPTGPVSTSTTGVSKQDMARSSKDMLRKKSKENEEKLKQRKISKDARAAEKGEGSFTFPDGQTLDYDQMNVAQKAYVAGQATKDAFQIDALQNPYGGFDLNDLNPLSGILGNMAGNLGIGLYNAIENKDYGSLGGAILDPVLTGTLSGIFSPGKSKVSSIKSLLDPTKEAKEAAKLVAAAAEENFIEEGAKQASKKVAKKIKEKIVEGVKGSEKPTVIKTTRTAPLETKLIDDKTGFKPRNILKKGGVIEDDMGQWAHPGKITKINSNQITMKGVNYPVLGISDLGDVQMMYPEQEYKFKGKTVTEYPQKKKGGWLDKYQ